MRPSSGRILASFARTFSYLANQLPQRARHYLLVLACLSLIALAWLVLDLPTRELFPALAAVSGGVVLTVLVCEIASRRDSGRIAAHVQNAAIALLWGGVIGALGLFFGSVAQCLTDSTADDAPPTGATARAEAPPIEDADAIRTFTARLPFVAECVEDEDARYVRRLEKVLRYAIDHEDWPRAREHFRRGQEGVARIERTRAHKSEHLHGYASDLRNGGDIDSIRGPALDLLGRNRKRQLLEILSSDRSQTEKRFAAAELLEEAAVENGLPIPDAIAGGPAEPEGGSPRTAEAPSGISPAPTAATAVPGPRPEPTATPNIAMELQPLPNPIAETGHGLFRIHEGSTLQQSTTGSTWEPIPFAGSAAPAAAAVARHRAGRLLVAWVEAREGVVTLLTSSLDPATKTWGGEPQHLKQLEHPVHSMTLSSVADGGHLIALRSVTGDDQLIWTMGGSSIVEAVEGEVLGVIASHRHYHVVEKVGDDVMSFVFDPARASSGIRTPLAIEPSAARAGFAAMAHQPTWLATNPIRASGRAGSSPVGLRPTS